LTHRDVEASTPNRPDGSDQHLFEPLFSRAGAWIAGLRDGLDSGDSDRIAELAASIEAIETEADRLRESARDGTLTATQRTEVVARLRELGSQALTCSGLAENSAMYARLGQSLSNPSTEYTAHGATHPRPVGRVQWEV